MNASRNISLKEINNIAKKMAKFYRVRYPTSIFYFDTGLYSINNTEINLIKKNKIDFILFAENTQHYLTTGEQIGVKVLTSQHMNNMQMIINDELISSYPPRIQQLINDEITKCYYKYLSIYQNAKTFSDFSEKNSFFYYLQSKKLYSDDPDENIDLVYQQIMERLNQLQECSRKKPEDPFYQILYEHDSDVINQVSDDASRQLVVSHFCNNVLWGSEMMGTRCVKVMSERQIKEIIDGTLLAKEYYINHLPDSVKANIKKEIEDTIKGKYFLEGELHLETIGKGKRQYVFGYTKHITKYKKCPRYFICGTMKRPMPGSSACSEYSDWSRKLNTLYTQCAIYADQMSPFIRFVMPPDIWFPQKRYDSEMDVSDFSIFNKIPVAIMQTTFHDNRFENNPIKIIYHFIFYDMSPDIEYKSMYEMGTIPVPTRLKLYSATKLETVLGQIWYSALITYNELMIIKAYRKVKHTFRSKKFKHILFMTNHDFDPEYIDRIGLEPVQLIVEKLTEYKGKPVKMNYLFYADLNCRDLFLFRDAIKSGKVIVYKHHDKNKYNLTNQYLKNNAMLEAGLKNVNTEDIQHCLEGRRFGRLMRQRGGYVDTFMNKLQITTKDKSKNNMYGLFDQDLVEPFIFQKLIKLNVSSKNLKTEAEKTYYQLSRYLDPHMLVDSVHFSARVTKTTFIHTHIYIHDRFFRKTTNVVDDLLQYKQQYKYLTIYRPLTDKFFNRYEIYHHYSLIKPGQKILVCGHSSLSDFEAIDYYIRKHSMDPVNMTLIYHPEIHLYGGDLLHKKILHLQQFVKFKVIIEPKFLEAPQLANKFYLIVDDYTIRPKSDMYNEYYHLRLKFAVILFTLKNLLVGGHFVFFVMNILLKCYADLILILSQFFESYDIYKYEIQAKYKFINTVVIFQGFKGINADSLDKLLDLYQKIQTYGPDILSTERDVPRLETFIYSLLDLNIKNEIYDQFREYNNRVLFSQYEFLKICYDAVENTKLVTKLSNNMIYESFKYVKEYDFDQVDYIGVDRNYNFFMDLLEDIYFRPTSLKYTFVKNLDAIDLHVGYLDDPYKILLYDNGRIAVTDRVIDTRNIVTWYVLKQYVRYYRPFAKFDLDLRKMVVKKYNTGDISQAWLKMYEILANNNLFDKNIDTLNTFHICEAPGSFIVAINHYIRTKTNIKNFNWMANSLNPNLANKEGTAFGDDYGLMAKYPKRWNFGADNTGDITHSVNLEYYRANLKNINFITSDCGIPYELESEEHHEMLKIHVAELVLILAVLSKGGSFVAKFFFPVHRTIEYHVLYLLYNLFQELIFYKPRVNIFSKEFYIIGHKYQGIEETMLQKIRELVGNNFSIDATIYSEIPTFFIQQLSVVQRKMVDDYILNFKKQLFYVDNHEELKLGRNFLDQIKIIIRNKNEDWCQDNQLVPIKSSDRL